MLTEDEQEEGLNAREGDVIEVEECSTCGTVCLHEEMVKGMCPACKKDADEFEPVVLTVEDLVTVERSVTLKTPFCPNCGGDLRRGSALVLVQYEGATQRTNIYMDDWETSEGCEDHIPVVWQCGDCNHPLIEAIEDRRRPATAPVPS
jgi:predicted RNA-binding Zn-ribbon protein involved in translation (DUF1610 family)